MVELVYRVMPRIERGLIFVRAHHTIERPRPMKHINVGHRPRIYVRWRLVIVDRHMIDIWHKSVLRKSCINTNSSSNNRPQVPHFHPRKYDNPAHKGIPLLQLPMNHYGIDPLHLQRRFEVSSRSRLRRQVHQFHQF